MRVLEGITQGSPEWLAARTQYFTASEAPAMMGASKYQTRSELLHQKATGLTPDVDRNKRALFDRGHAAEAAARTILEELTGEEFFPVTAVSDTGKLLASVDGITMGDDVLFEHKLWSESLAAQVGAGELEPHYTWQLEQQLLVTGAKKVIFVCSDGTRENWAQMEYLPVPGRAENLLAAWQQFEQDLAAYVPPEAAAPLPTGRAPETLPALRIEVTGMVTGSNLDVFKAHALAVFAGINRELSTDAQFADAEKTVKWCADVEDRLAAAKQHALSQTASIDELFRTVDEISAEARRVRLDLDKLVKARKETIRGEIVADGVSALREHIAALNERLGKPYMPPVPADFGGVIKGKRTIESLRDAVNTELARAKIAANEVADLIHTNIQAIPSVGSPFSLVEDFATICTKPADDFRALMELRVRQHQERMDVARERIRAEELARIEREQAAAAPALAAAPVVAAVTANMPVAAAPAANVVPMRAPMASATPPSLKLGQIGERLGFSLTGDFLKSLGFEPAARDKNALLFHEADFALICMRLVAHVQGVQAKQAA